jgi:nondiscriminating aspartyl-tRNA synthetase
MALERVRIAQIGKNVGKEVLIEGRVLTVRELGTITFALVQDYTGTVQTVWSGKTKAKAQDAVSIVGKVRADKRSKTGFEMEGSELTVISTSTEELPIDLTKSEMKLQLKTLLDLRPLSLRHPKNQAIFKLYDVLLGAYAQAMHSNGFTEIKTPKLLGAASESGANCFKIEYFGKKAYLAQSPQFYKQMMVGVFERVFEIGTVFRAEPHYTTRHVNEYISLDAEMGFIKGFEDVTSMLNNVLKFVFETVGEKGAEYLAAYKATAPVVPKEIPRVKLSEIKKIIKKKYGYSVPEATDIDPEGERLAGRYAKEEHDSDFIFLTHYPWETRPFYTMPDKETPGETLGFDLLFRGLEIVTGGQRIHLYKELMANIEKKGVKPTGIEPYLDVFKFAMPPHGGWGMGSERLIQQILGLKSIKEAVLFPRDVKRLGP